MKAIQTVYKGYLFRSRLEARYAVLFDALGIEWRYEPEGFDLGEQGWYLPDFWLETVQMWAEVKPKAFSPTEAAKCQALAMQSGFPCLMLDGDPVYRPYQGYETLESQITQNDWLIDDSYLDEHRFYSAAYTPEEGEGSQCTKAAYLSARQARFEHGEIPRLPMKLPKSGQQHHHKPTREAIHIVQQEAAHKAEHLVFGLLVTHPDQESVILGIVDPEDFSLIDLQKLMEFVKNVGVLCLLEITQTGETPAIFQIIEQARSEFAAVYGATIGDIERVAEQLAFRIRRFSITSRLRSLSHIHREAQAKGDTTALRACQLEGLELTEKLRELEKKGIARH